MALASARTSWVESTVEGSAGEDRLGRPLDVPKDQRLDLAEMTAAEGARDAIFIKLLSEIPSLFLTSQRPLDGFRK